MSVITQNTQTPLQTQEMIYSENIFFGHSFAKNPKLLDPIQNRFFRHTNEKHQLILFLSGACETVTDDFSQTLKTGDVCFNPANTYYHINFLGDEPYERVVIHIVPNEAFDNLVFEVFDDLRPINLDLHNVLLPFINRYKEYSKLLSVKDFSKLAQSMLTELLYLCLMKKSPMGHETNNQDALLKKAISYIEENWATIKNVNEISHALFISPSYLYDLFNKKLGIAPKTYLLQKRLKYANTYLHFGFPPNEVSRLVGFNTYTAFYRSCKAFFGKSPQELWVKKSNK